MAVRAFAHDKKLKAWYEANCNGRLLSDAPSIIAEGVAKNEITDEQAKTLSQVLGFAGEAAFGPDAKTAKEILSGK